MTCDLPEIDIQVEVAAPNKKTVIHLSGTAIDKDSPRARKHQGRIKGNLHIRTDLPHLPEMVVPISYMVRM
ncbi:hypothetical protein CSA17_01495 [bacterium DOLJORAL78_65_58]|nr:MAG: hypothetical protein CSA17_01495 [bacterium DOLJORAL78_65_58]